MYFKTRFAACLCFFISFLPAKGQEISIVTPKITLVLAYGDKAAFIGSMIVNGQTVSSGVFTSFDGASSLHLVSAPVLTRTAKVVKLSGIRYGHGIEEQWTFKINGPSIQWEIRRSLSRPLWVEEAGSPVFQFDDMGIWEGAYQGYGGLAWFSLFNDTVCAYGVHTTSSDFWNSGTGNGLRIAVDAPGKKVAVKYAKTADNKLAYAVTVSSNELLPRLDSGTHRRRFIRGRTDVWAPFTMGPGVQTITLSYFDFNEKYGRGKFAGVNGNEVGAVLNTIARIGVIDSLHFGGNSWHTPYGPICLHEQYIAQLGLAIDDPAYLRGYQSCLDFYRDHAIKPDGRVFARWAYTNEDMMPGQVNKYGFYEAQWGYLMDSNPDLVSNVADLFDLTGDKDWVKRHQLSCEAALDWILARDTNGNGLVEVMTDKETQKRGSDWIDIIWASFENAFVNAKLYHALVKWAAIERQLANAPKAKKYQDFAARLKATFNKPVSEGGFWDPQDTCYVHWIDKDGSVHGRNMVTPVNFMAIVYGICDDTVRRKLILDKIEAQMQCEQLFFWPLCMTSYAPGEGNDWQFPFPAYENGDLFLSWGSIGVAAYAAYKPDLAVKYVRNVLDRYSRDGLTFQRYGRLKQDGLGDDILSGNSLAVVGLYQAIYGINPLYNRFYLDPHMTPELFGTSLIYRFRGDRLTIDLDSGRYVVSDGKFKIISSEDFGFNRVRNRLSYFDRANSSAALEVVSGKRLTLDIKKWSTDAMEWVQTLDEASSLIYVVHRLRPDGRYKFFINGKIVGMVKSDSLGDLVVNHVGPSVDERITVSPSN